MNSKKDRKYTVVHLNEPLSFGLYEGERPCDMFSDREKIKYLLWLRSATHNTEWSKGKVIPVIPYKSKMSKDLLMVLDHFLRNCPHMQAEHKVTYTLAEFEIWKKEYIERQAELEKQEREMKKKIDETYGKNWSTW